MAARKPKVQAPVPTMPEVIAPVSSTGADLDPIDGRPVFHDGMSRRRYLDATAEDRAAQLLEELRAEGANTDDEPDAA